MQVALAFFSCCLAFAELASLSQRVDFSSC
jgi:hypothetical protein